MSNSTVKVFGKKKRMGETEVKMLRWMWGDTKMDRTKNEKIRGTDKMA